MSKKEEKLRREIEQLKQHKKMGWKKKLLIIGGVSFGVLIGLGVIGSFIEDEPVPTVSKSVVKTPKKQPELKEVTEEEEIDEDRLKGFHCLSSWNGSHRELVNIVKPLLHDSSSFKHVKTLVGRERDGWHAITMTFSGKNLFNARVEQTAKARYSHKSCEIDEDSLEVY